MYLDNVPLRYGDIILIYTTIGIMFSEYMSPEYASFLLICARYSIKFSIIPFSQICILRTFQRLSRHSAHPRLRLIAEFKGHFRHPGQMIFEPMPFLLRLSLPGMSVEIVFHGVVP
jgi:hypothetical protein